MSSKTAIEWTDATWNPVTGCTKVSQGCKNCYAETWANRHMGEFSKDHSRKFTDVRGHPDKLEIPLRWRKPKKIFVNSMSDLFHPDVPLSFIEEVYWIMERCKQHTFQVLTKRPERMFQFFEETRIANLTNGDPIPLANVWWGVSVEDQTTADERIPLLLEIPAAVRWVSMEPLLGEVVLNSYKRKIDWIVVGGESGINARPMNPAWVADLRDHCVLTKTPFFFKQWGEWCPYESINEIDPDIDDVEEYKFAGMYNTVYRVGKKKTSQSFQCEYYRQYPETVQ